MKRQIKNHLSGRRLILPALTALALSMMIAPAGAQAAVRIGVKVNTPVVTAVLHSGGYGPGLQIRVPAGQRGIELTKVDRRIARQLAKRTVYNKSELLQLRRAGYSWDQVGRLLRIPSRLMQSVLPGHGIRCGNDSHLDRNHRSSGKDRAERDGERDQRRERPLKKSKLVR